jgi:carbon-monoxide dehydrogenase medium subunit
MRPSTLDEAVRLLADTTTESKILAGGQSLIPLLNFRLAFPQRLVDIKGIAELAYIRRSPGQPGRLNIGATTRTRDIEQSKDVQQSVPILAEACHWVGHVQIRNRGTIGGSLAHADPSAEIPAVCVLLDAELKIRGKQGTRTAKANGFFHGFLSTDLAPDEILEEISLPTLPQGARWGFREFAHRRGDFALAGAACTLQLNPDGSIKEARAVIFGATDAPARASATEASLKNKKPVQQTIQDAASQASRSLQQTRDGQSHNPDRAYRTELAEVMLRRALEDAVRHGRTTTQEAAE